jgi:hypothetical protein
MSGFNQQQQQRMRMMYNQPQSQQQQPPQINNPMNRTPGQGVMRPGTNVRPEQHIMPPHQSPILPQQQQQQLLMQQQLQQQSPAQPMPQPSPQTQQPLSNLSQQQIFVTTISWGKSVFTKLFLTLFYSSVRCTD